MNGFEKRALRIKEKIKSTMLQMLATGNPKQLRVADIAKAAGVSQVTIYNYFGSKEALLRDVFIDYMNLKTDEAEIFLRESHSLKAKIQFLIVQKQESSKSFTAELLQQMMDQDPLIVEYIQNHYQQKALPLMTNLVESGKTAGEISDKVSVQTIMLFLDMMNQHMAVMLQAIGQSANTDQMIEETLHLFFYGICGYESQK